MLAATILAAALAAAQPITIDAALLEGLPLAEAEVTIHGEKLACSGPRLRDVAGKLGLPQGRNLGGPMLANGLLLRSRDGYAVLFSLGELDVTLGNSEAIIAARCNGQALDEKTGPYRLIVPGEARPARAARQVISIELIAPQNLPQDRHGH